MRDGSTERLEREPRPGLRAFLDRYQAKLVAVSGPSAGHEYPLDRDVMLVGRGPSVDLVFDDPSMSRQHAAVEFVESGFRVRDLGSTNGVLVNGTRVQVGAIADGDRFDVGDLSFQLVIEEAADEPEVYEIGDV